MKKISTIVFDLGGTLINYEGLPLYWGDHYKDAFQNVKEKLKINLSESQIDESVEILKKFNPRIYPREVEYDSEYIFSYVINGWKLEKEDIKAIANSFFSYFKKKVIVYEDTYDILKYLKEKEYLTGILTDLPTGMPDELIKEDISSFSDMIDCYVSSAICGYRKPNKSGLLMISKALNTPITNMIFIGDEEKDVKTAQNAGCVSILINRKNEAINYGQDYQVNTFTEVIEVLKHYSFQTYGH